MIFVILAISILMFILGVFLFAEFELEFIGCCTGLLSVITFLISIIVLITLCCSVTNLRTVDARIEMYQEENTRIEQQIAETVQQYQQHETNIFTEVAPESSMTLVALYPELKSDALVQQQIEIYISNNEKIKELREEKIQGSVNRWWLYFGK